MKVRFLADADLNKAIVSGVLRREPAIDFLTTHDAGLRKLKDPEVLALAAGQKRVLVSHDTGSMPAHFRAFAKCWQTQRRRVPRPANPRYRDRNRGTSAHLAGFRGIGVGKPAGMVAALIAKH